MSERPIPGTCSAFAERGAGHSKVPYLALHPMGFSVPRRLLFERWALTPPFHPYLFEISNLRFEISNGRYILCGTVRQDASRHHCPRVSPPPQRKSYAASRPVEFGLSSPGQHERAGSDSPPFRNQPNDISLQEAIQEATRFAAVEHPCWMGRAGWRGRPGISSKTVADH